MIRKTPSRTTATEGNTKSSPMAEKPCRYFISDGGCKAGKSCKWLHSWDGVTDKSSRCWICGANRNHRKSECKVKAAPRKPGEPSGSGGGTGQGRGGSSNDVSTSTTTATSSATGGKAGAAAAKVLQNTDKDRALHPLHQLQHFRRR